MATVINRRTPKPVGFALAARAVDPETRFSPLGQVGRLQGSLERWRPARSFDGTVQWVHQGDQRKATRGDGVEDRTLRPSPLCMQELKDLELELDARREIGIIFRDSKVANSLVKVFEEDWKAATAPKPEATKEQTAPAVTRTSKKVAKTVTKDLHPVAPVLKAAVKDVMPPDTNLDVDYKEVEENVKDAVKEAVQDVVKGAVEDVVEHKEPGEKR